MSLNADQITQALQLLGLPVRTDVTFAFAGDSAKLRRAEIATKALQTVNASQETAVVAILAQYAPLMFDTDTIKADGLDSSPARARSHLAKMLADTIGFTLPLGNGFRIGRG